LDNCTQYSEFAGNSIIVFCISPFNCAICELFVVRDLMVLLYRCQQLYGSDENGLRNLPPSEECH